MPGASRYCTEWGYFIGGAPDPLPTLVSRLIDVAYNARICEYAFPPGKHSSVPVMPNVTRINQYGDYALKASRLAIIDGDEDPWIFATAHSPDAVPRNDTHSEPYKIIKGVRCLTSCGCAYAEHCFRAFTIMMSTGTIRSRPISQKSINNRLLSSRNGCESMPQSKRNYEVRRW